MQWSRREDGVVTGALVDHRLAFLRNEMAALQRLARRRLDSMPALLPFGSGVDFAVSGSLPQDERCRVLLAGFMPDEEDWVRQWWELELWCRLEVCARLVESVVLDDDDGLVEVAEPALAEVFVMALQAVAMLAEHRYGTDGEHAWVGHWLRHVAETLAAA